MVGILSTEIIHVQNNKLYLTILTKAVMLLMPVYMVYIMQLIFMKLNCYGKWMCSSIYERVDSTLNEYSYS